MSDECRWNGQLSWREPSRVVSQPQTSSFSRSGFILAPVHSTNALSGDMLIEDQTYHNILNIYSHRLRWEVVGGRRGASLPSSGKEYKQFYYVIHFLNLIYFNQRVTSCFGTHTGNDEDNLSFDRTKSLFGSAGSISSANEHTYVFSFYSSEGNRSMQPHKTPQPST